MLVIRRRVPAAIAALALCLLAACSSSNSSSGGGGKANAAQKAAVAKSIDAVAQYKKEQPPIEVPKLTKPAPKNVRLAVLTCAVPVCRAGTDPAVSAAKKLGWFVYQTQVQVTTNSYISGWNAVLQQNPTAIAYVAEFPSNVVASQIAEAKRRGIHLVAITYNAPSRKASGADYAVSGVPSTQRTGELLGDVVAADAKGPTEAVFVWDPTIGNTLTPVLNGLKSTAVPAGVDLKILNVSIAGVGQAVPGQIVSYVQRNPNVKYLIMSLADFGSGVPQALRAVGLDKKVKIISRAPQAGDLAQIKSGEQFAAVAEEVSAAGYRAVDDIVRLSLGQQPTSVDPPGWHQILFQDNITQTSRQQPTPGVPDAFEAAWGVSS